MNIKVYITPFNQICELIIQLLVSEFKVGNAISEELYKRHIAPHFHTLKESTYFLAETNYVDKTYRDSYYKYYSSKSNDYQKNCIRISIFDGPIKYSDFRSRKKRETLSKKYLGFYVLRPTWPNVIGRSVITPFALKENHFSCCITNFNTSVNGLDFSVKGFPHSSQDSETITCAETALWAIMEYFGNKYSDYNPVLPSKIIQTLNKISYERQIPSKGLDILQMSYTLKQFGFGSRFYSKEIYGDEFERLISCYIESGIPLIISIENKNIHHALLAIGHEEVDENQIDQILPLVKETNSNGTKLTIYDYDSAEKNFIFIDDNRPVYQKATLRRPAAHYTDEEWQDCSIDYFIVPLYPKIYLEAVEAKRSIIKFLFNYFTLDKDTSLLLRTYLASSRSFKANLALNNSFNEDAKAIIMETSMPKFIWVAEVTSKELIKNRKAQGMILLDATEANISYYKPLILAFLQEKMLSLNKYSGILESSMLYSEPFEIYEHNLKTYKS